MLKRLLNVRAWPQPSKVPGPSRVFVPLAVLTVCVSLLPALSEGADGVQARAAWRGASCSTTVRVIGARGSGEDFSEKQLNMGDTVDDAFEEYRRQVDGGGRSVQGVGTIYPAQDVKLLVVDKAKYFKGLDDGVDDVVSDLRQYAKRCSSERFVLVGYSQGAMVMHRAVWKLADIGFDLGRIDGVIAIADGDRKPVDGVREHGTVRGGDGVSYLFPKLSGGKYTAKAGVPKALRGRFHSVCLMFDIVCDTKAAHFSSLATAPAGVANHGKYKRGKPAWGAVKSAVSAVARVTKSVPVSTTVPTAEPTACVSSPPPSSAPTTSLVVGPLTLDYSAEWADAAYGPLGLGQQSTATDVTGCANGNRAVLQVVAMSDCPPSGLVQCLAFSWNDHTFLGPAPVLTVGGRAPSDSSRTGGSLNGESLVWCFSAEMTCVAYRGGAGAEGLVPSPALVSLLAEGRWSS